VKYTANQLKQLKLAAKPVAHCPLRGVNGPKCSDCVAYIPHHKGDCGDHARKLLKRALRVGKKTLEARALQYAHRHGTDKALPIDFQETWLAGYRAGKKDSV
jgi:hypothetical protein